MAISEQSAQAQSRPWKVSRNVLEEHLTALLCISPWLLGFLAIEIGPILTAFWLSLTKYNIIKPAKFIGLSNYQEMLTTDKLFWQSLKVSANYAAGSVILGIILGVGLALLLNQNVRGIAFYRTGFYLPAVVSGVAVAYMWILVLQQEGILNAMLGFIGIDGPNWLYTREWALPAFILMSLWQVGGGMVLYLAGLQGVPTELYEAASIDGAGRFAKFGNVTLPMISPVIFFNFIIGIIGSFQVFTGGFIITKGGPVDATMFYVLHLYFKAFESLRMGYGSALGVVLFAIIMALTYLSFRASNRLVYYEGRLR